MPQSHTATSMLTFCACTQWLGGLPVHAVDAAGAVGPPGAPGGIGAGRSTMGSCPSPMLAGARTEAGSCRTLGPEVLLSCVCVCGWVWGKRGGGPWRAVGSGGAAGLWWCGGGGGGGWVVAISHPHL